MRILTPSEQREIEQLKNQIVKELYASDDTVKIVITINNRELWLNILDMVLQTQDAMREAWLSSANPKINLRG